MTLSTQALRREFDHDRNRACPQGRARRLTHLNGLRGAAFRLFLLALPALFAVSAPAQTEDAPLPGVARAAAAAFGHFSDPALSPENVRAMAFRHTSEPLFSTEHARSAENLRHHELRITETDTDYRVEVRFTGVVYGESDRGIVASRRYRVDKEDFRLLEARQQTFTGTRDNVTQEVLLSQPPAVRWNDAPPPGFSRAIAVAHQEMVSHLKPRPDARLHIRNTVIIVNEGDDHYRVAFNPKPELGIPGTLAIYFLDKRDFRMLPPEWIERKARRAREARETRQSPQMTGKP